jgi:SPW repeat
MWKDWVNGILGIWVLVIPFAMGVTDSALTTTLVVTGIVIAILGFWAAAAPKSM